MPNIKEQLKVSRASIFMTKAHNLHAHRRALSIRTESFKQKTAQRVDRVIRSIDNLIGKRTDLRHCLPFRANCRQQSLPLSAGCGRRVSLKRSLQNIVRRFKEEHVHFQTRRAQSIELFSEICKKATFANVDHKCGAANTLLVLRQTLPAGQTSAASWSEDYRRRSSRDPGRRWLRKTCPSRSGR